MDQPWLGYVWQLPDQDGYNVIHANVLNYHNQDADDLTLEIFNLDTGELFVSDRFDIDDNSVASRTFYIDSPYSSYGVPFSAYVSLLDEDNKVLDSRFVYIEDDY